MTVQQAAVRLGCSAGTVYALVAARRLRASRVGLGRGKIAISEEAIAEYLAATESGPSVGLAASVPVAKPKLKFEHLKIG